MNTESALKILSYLFDHLEGLAGLVSLGVALKVWKQSQTDKQDASRDKQIEIYLDLHEQWDLQWAKITAFPEENKVLFHKSFSSLQDENIRVSIIQAVNILSRAHYYFEKTGQDIDSSEWKEIIKTVAKKPVFVTAFNESKFRYRQEFQQYMMDRIKKEQAKRSSKTFNIVQAPKPERKMIFTVKN